MRTCDGSRVVELIVLGKLKSVRTHYCNGTSGSGRLMPVNMGRDVARRIIVYVKSLDRATRECLINVLSVLYEVYDKVVCSIVEVIVVHAARSGHSKMDAV